MAVFKPLVDHIAQSLPADLDVCVSFVLFGNARDEIVRAIVQVQRSRMKTQVVLIDNSTPPLDLGYAQDMGAIVAATCRNAGYGRGHNVALAASRGKCRYHLVMNTDLEMTSDVIAGMVTFMDAHPIAGLAMPKVRYPDGSIQHLCRLLPNPADIAARRLLSKTAWAKAKNDRYEFHGWDYDTIAQFPFLSGCFMLLRHSVLDQVGYFDERYFLYAEDLDLSRRIHAVAQTLYNPGEVVTHEYRSKSSPSFARLRYASVSLSRYFFKWGWIVDRDRDRINHATIAQFQ